MVSSPQVGSFSVAGDEKGSPSSYPGVLGRGANRQEQWWGQGGRTHMQARGQGWEEGLAGAGLSAAGIRRLEQGWRLLTSRLSSVQPV